MKGFRKRIRRGFRGSVWGGRRLWLWVLPLVFLLVNLGALVVYRMVFADEAAVSQARLEEAQTRLQELQAQREVLESYLGRIENTRERIFRLYESDMASEEQRLTTILREVKRLAREANLEPGATSYPKEELEEYGLTKRSFVFSVQGTYFNLRKLINSLELSDYFLTLEHVGLSESTGRAGNQLNISLQLSTLFAEEGAGLEALSNEGSS